MTEPTHADRGIRSLVPCVKDDVCAHDNTCRNHILLASELASVRAKAAKSLPKMCPVCGYRCVGPTVVLGDSGCHHCKAIAEAAVSERLHLKQLCDSDAGKSCGQEHELEEVSSQNKAKAKSRAWERAYRCNCIVCEDVHKQYETREDGQVVPLQMEE